jgi:hypothetical protein
MENVIVGTILRDMVYDKTTFHCKRSYRLPLDGSQSFVDIISLGITVGQNRPTIEKGR